MQARRKRWRVPALIAGGVAVGLSFGNATAAHADAVLANEPAPPPIKVDLVGDSQIAGEGLHGTYFDANDVRHQSRQSAPAQALARLVAANPDLTVDARTAAASGALTMDFFRPQELDGKVVNKPQVDQIRPDADVVVVGFGGSDAMTTRLMHAAAGTADPGTFDKLLATVEPGLSALASDEIYRKQAANSQPGLAPTLTARMLQVLDATKAKAPKAKVVVTNYPILVDPSRSAKFKEFSADELTRLHEFGQRLNASIDRAVRICECATLADASKAIEGREAYAEDAAVNDLSVGKGGPATDHRAREVFQPNVEGAGLIAEPIVGALAKALSIEAPKEPAKEPTKTDAITLAPAVAKVPATPVRSEKARPQKPRPAAQPDRADPGRPDGHSAQEVSQQSGLPAREPVVVPTVLREVVVVAQPIVRLVPVVLGIAPAPESADEKPAPAADEAAEEPAEEPAEADENGEVEEVEEERTLRSWAAARLEQERSEDVDPTPADEVEADEQSEPAETESEGAESEGPESEGAESEGAESEETDETEKADGRWAAHLSRERAQRDDALARREVWQRREETEIHYADLLPCAVTEAAAVDMVPCPPVAEQSSTEGDVTAEESAPEEIRYRH